jgi:plastocyanin
VLVPALPTIASGASQLDVSGEVTLVDTKVGHALKDASQAVVWLVSTDPVQAVRAKVDTRHYKLLQRNKRFEPSLLVVPVGSVVDFPNADPWFHNVFSLYRGKRFDLGLYQAGAQKSVKFDRPGPSYLFCNIHPEMTGVVLAVESELFGISDKAGHYTIASVPPGTYSLHVWHVNAAPKELQALEWAIRIESGNQTLPVISIPVMPQQTKKEHKNKYDQDYDPDNLKTIY